MQPPPRKSNYAKFLKNLHSEQIAKLLAKNQHECDLLEDIRQYTIKRSAIEKSYSDALLKISSGYLNKKIPNIPDIKVDGAEEKWNMWNVWRTVLEENEKLARARLAAVEVFQQQIADEAKVLRQHKVNVSKKCIDQLSLTHKELQLCVQEVDKNKKLYFDEEHSAHDVRDKAKDIEEKLKRKKGSFFQSITSLQKNSAKVSSRRDALEEKSSGARNDYLLSLAAANAHQNRYFLVDLQQCMQQMESHVYERVAEHLTLMGRTELLTCSATQHSFGKIRDQAQQLTRDYNLQCCYLYYPVLKQHIQYEFEACDNDPIDTVTIEHESAAATLSSEVRRWVTRVARENNAIRESNRKLQVCQALRDSGQKNDPNDPNGPDLDTRIDELRSSIRRSETAKLKYEARVECLRVGGAPVDEWLKELDSLAVQDAMPRSSSMTSVRTDVSGNPEQSSDSFYDSDTEGGDIRTEEPRARASTASSGAAAADDDVDEDVDAVIESETRRIEQLTAGWDDPTQVSWGEESAEGEQSTAVAPGTDGGEGQTGTAFKCTALYSYTAQNPDELSIIENEQLEVVGEGDGDGWLRARNYRGEEGFVPQNYLDVEREESTSANPGLLNQPSFSSVDYTVEGEDAELVQSPDQISVISAPLIKKEVVQAATVVETTIEPFVESVAPPSGIGSAIEYCFAMYDYDSDAPDELVLEEGQIIKIIDKCVHGVDDGWWRGESNGITGNFPSVIVELCDEDGEPLSACEDEEDWTPASDHEHAVFTSAPASPGRIEDTCTQLDGVDVSNMIISENNNCKRIAPPMEPPPPPPFVEEDEEDEGDDGSRSYFNLELSRNQQHHYGTQFSQSEGPEVTIIVDEVLADPMDDEDAEQTLVLERVVQPTPPNNKDKKKTQKKADSSELGLGVAQIVITAATPMTEEPDQPFPPAEEALEKHEALDDANQQMDDNDMENDESSLSEQTAVAVKPLHQEETDDQPTDSAPFPTSSSTASEAESTGPSTADEIGGSGPSTAPQSPPKQVQGGRASIPDELEPHQLARLQDLKESNA